MTDSAHEGGGGVPAVEVRDLVKRYSRSPVNAVDGLTFSIGRGEAFGLLGPNGAGKTTTVRMLTTLVAPTSGTIRVAGVDVSQRPLRARKRLGVIPQLCNLDRSLNIWQNLVTHAAYHGVPRGERTRRADELLEELGLADRAKDKVDFLSGGQQQRVMIARALMHSPQVLFLDEPSSGLDPAARLFLWDRLRELRRRGVTLVLTTHDMEEAATLADRVGVIDHGKLLALGAPAALTRQLPGSSTLDVELTAHDGDTVEPLLADLRALDRIERVEQVEDSAGGGFAGGFPGGGFPGFGGFAFPGAPEAPSGPSGLRLRLYVSGEAVALIAPVSAVVSKHGRELTDLSIGRPSLEDVFIHLTGRALR